MTISPIRVLIVDDDEDDAILVREMLSDSASIPFELKSVKTYETALPLLCSDQFDICLLDYRLGGKTGVELLREARTRGMTTPAIVLTGFGDRAVDLKAMQSGASDYLEKGRISPALLERSIRYAIEHSRIAAALQVLSRKVLSAQEDERKRLALELHDSIGSSLTAIKLGLENKLESMKSSPADPDSIRLEDIISLVYHTIREVKKIQISLRPPIIDDLGIIRAIQALCRQFKKLNPSPAISSTLFIEEGEIPEHLKIVIYRITQEALHNVSKHSKARNARVLLGRSTEYLELCIEDDGLGFDLAKLVMKPGSAPGMGIGSMRERAEYSGGKFTIISGDHSGTRICVAWPADQLPANGSALRD